MMRVVAAIFTNTTSLSRIRSFIVRVAVIMHVSKPNRDTGNSNSSSDQICSRSECSKNRAWLRTTHHLLNRTTRIADKSLTSHAIDRKRWARRANCCCASLPRPAPRSALSIQTEANLRLSWEGRAQACQDLVVTEDSDAYYHCRGSRVFERLDSCD